MLYIHMYIDRFTIVTYYVFFFLKYILIYQLKILVLVKLQYTLTLFNIEFYHM